MIEEQEKRLIQRLQDDDEQAYGELLDHHLPPVSAYVKRMLFNAPEAEDITQETFIRLWTARNTFEPNRVRLTTWLHRIAQNLCIDHLRKQKPLPDESPSQTAGPEKHHEDEQQTQQLGKALMQLEERQRSALILCHYQGLRQADAANILNVSPQALESLLRRSRKRLSTLMTDRGANEH